MFQTSVLTGLVNHVIWVWPNWDWDKLNLTEQDHLVYDVEIGYMEIKVLEEIGRHRLDLCACWKLRETHGKEKTDSWECHRRNFTVTDPEDGPDIDRFSCQFHSKAVLEIVSESAAVSQLRKIKPSDQNTGLILDIDEDFYGCWSDMIPLEEAGIQRKDVDILSDFVAELFCCHTANEEQLANEFYSSLVYLVINLKSQSCAMKHQHQGERRNCLTDVEVSNHLIENIPSMLDFLRSVNSEIILCKKDTKISGFYLQALLMSFQDFSVKQLKLLAKLGICFTVSPTSRYFQTEGEFHICHGENMPNRTLVSFHLPADLEIMTQTTNLRKIFRSFFQKPNLVTVCRSVRDGYTPKQFFSIIEPNVLQSVAYSFRSVQFENIHFDSNLLGGKFGWSHHPHGWNHKLLQYLSLQEVSDF